MKNYGCQTCHYFVENTVLGPNSGECHRRSPRGCDAGGMSNGVQRLQHFQADYIIDSIISEVPVHLFKCNFEPRDEASPLPIAKETLVGIDSDEINPFICRYASHVCQVTVVATKINVGAATKGTDIRLKIGLVQVKGTSSILIDTIEVPVPTNQVGVFGSSTLGNVAFTYDLLETDYIPIQNAAFGFWIDLDTTNSPDYIAQIRNPHVRIACVDDYGVSRPFSLIPDKTTIWCGQYRTLSAEKIETCWTCDFFEPANVGIDNSGHCRRNAPTKFDQAAIPDRFQPVEAGIDFTNLFPYHEDGTATFCGEYKKSTSAVPDPV